jgi:hypothetical protein
MSGTDQAHDLCVVARERDYRAAGLPWFALALLAFLYPTVIAVTKPGLVYDDPFILMRYGQHLANGQGWDINLGSATENAVTSPLYVLLLAAGKFMGAPLTVWSSCIYTIAWGSGGLLLARVLMRDGYRLAAWLACALYSLSPLLSSVRGMETSVYLLIILAAVWCLQVNAGLCSDVRWGC